jgi:membrane protein implicated in regulation of membrane protease activity
MIWIIVGLGLCLLEIFTPGFFVLLFGIAAIITGIASFLGLSITLQWILFILLCLILVLFVRKYFMRMLNLQPTQIANVQGLIGKTAIVTHPIEKGSMKGRIRIEGEDWIAVTEEEGLFEAGKTVTIISISGTKLVIGKGS